MSQPDTPSAESQREEALFAEALKRPLPERAAFLDDACRGNTPLRRRLDALLMAHNSPEALPEPSESLRPGSFAGSSEPDPLVGQRIGRYKLVERIGEGGCGVVYVAEQIEPVRRQVALKLIKPGMDTKQVIARFEAERQAMAMMGHPNIAKALDAGTTESGRPYFVMELVRGVKLTDYCDQNHLSTRKRLELFIQVCRAVQDAHQKGIIHRDLKPSNILVTLHNGEPVPKIIDFGIAKAVNNQSLTDKTIYTAFEQFIGTPAYMSPEQAQMTNSDVDTRTDIYSLGVLLYELLTGRTPFDSKELISSGLDAMRKTICEKEPPRPSTRLATLAGNELTTTAQRRSADAPKLIRQLSGDLDWIVIKCLEKDRERRYETADGLAMDVQRHLENEPIVARPPSTAYRFQKLVRRNKFAVATAVAVFASLFIGLGISTWMYFKERSARQLALAAELTARSEATRSQQIASFMQDMLNAAGPAVARGRDPTLLREILDQTAERLDKQELQNEPQVESELREVIGNVYADIGEYAKAANMINRSLAIRNKFYGAETPEFADSLRTLGVVYIRQGKLHDAEVVHRQTLQIRRKLLGEDNFPVAQSLNDLGQTLLLEGDSSGAESFQRQALAIEQKLLATEDPAIVEPEIIGSKVLLALALDKQPDKAPEAEGLARQCLDYDTAHNGTNNPQRANMEDTLGMALEAQGKMGGAEQAFLDGLEVRRKLLGEDHPDLRFSYEHLAEIYKAEGRLKDEQEAIRQQLDIEQKNIGTK